MAPLNGLILRHTYCMKHMKSINHIPSAPVTLLLKSHILDAEFCNSVSLDESVDKCDGSLIKIRTLKRPSACMPSSKSDSNFTACDVNVYADNFHIGLSDIWSINSWWHTIHQQHRILEEYHWTYKTAIDKTVLFYTVGVSTKHTIHSWCTRELSLFFGLSQENYVI